MKEQLEQHCLFMGAFNFLTLAGDWIALFFTKMEIF